MITAPGGWLTLTRAVGMASFGGAAAASCRAWSSMSGRRIFRVGKATRLPMMLTLIHAIFFLDIVFNWRWQLHDFLEGLAMNGHVYQDRRLPQALVLMAVGAVSGVVALNLIRSRSGLGKGRGSRGAMLALLGTGIGAASWCMEVISLHQVDALLYASKGPFMPVAAIWIMVGLMTATGITSYARHASPGA